MSKMITVHVDLVDPTAAPGEEMLEGMFKRTIAIGKFLEREQIQAEFGRNINRWRVMTLTVDPIDAVKLKITFPLVDLEKRKREEQEEREAARVSLNRYQGYAVRQHETNHASEDDK